MELVVSAEQLYDVLDLGEVSKVESLPHIISMD